MNDEMILNIEDDTFWELRASLNRTLCTVLKKMHVRDSDDAEITMKMKIRLTDQKTSDLKTGEIRMVKNPEIKFNVSHKLEYKKTDEESGTIQAADSQLVCENGIWKIKHIDDGQMKLTDYVK